MCIRDRLRALAAHVGAVGRFEGPWAVFRYGQFKGHEEAATAVSTWARRRSIAVGFDIRRVRDVDVIFVILSVLA